MIHYNTGLQARRAVSILLQPITEYIQKISPSQARSACERNRNLECPTPGFTVNIYCIGTPDMAAYISEFTAC